MFRYSNCSTISSIPVDAKVELQSSDHGLSNRKIERLDSMPGMFWSWIPALIWFFECLQLIESFGMQMEILAIAGLFIGYIWSFYVAVVAVWFNPLSLLEFWLEEETDLWQEAGCVDVCVMGSAIFRVGLVCWHGCRSAICAAVVDFPGTWLADLLNRSECMTLLELSICHRSIWWKTNDSFA